MPLCCPQIGLLKQLFGGNNISAVNQNANTLEQWMGRRALPIALIASGGGSGTVPLLRTAAAFAAAGLQHKPR